MKPKISPVDADVLRPCGERGRYHVQRGRRLYPGLNKAAGAAGAAARVPPD